MDLKAIIRKTLPNIEDEILENVVAGLIKEGIDSEDELHLLEKNNFHPSLKPIKVKKLLEAWAGKKISIRACVSRGEFVHLKLWG